MTTTTRLTPREFAVRTRHTVLDGRLDPSVNFQHAHDVGRPCSLGVMLAIALAEPIIDPTYTGGPYYATTPGVRTACDALDTTRGALNSLLWICGAPASPLGLRSPHWPSARRQLVWDRLALLEVMPSFDGRRRRVGVLTDALRSANWRYWRDTYGIDVHDMPAHHQRASFWLDLEDRLENAATTGR